MSLNNIIAATQRLKILQLLAPQANYSASKQIIFDAFNEFSVAGVGGIGFDKLITELNWLEEQGLLQTVKEDAELVRITNRGLDVAKQRVNHPGVAKPLPE